METGTINYFAVLVAALSTFLIGGLWYSPLLFQKAWMRANNLSEQQLSQANSVKMFGFSLLFALIMAFNLAMFLSGEGTDVVWGATAGLLAGLGWVALAVATIALFEQRPWSYILINGGYQTVAFVVMGAILGAWR